MYSSGKVTSQVRLLQDQTILEDYRKLSDYSLQEGATISALFEPDVDINIDVSTGFLKQTFSISNTTSVKALKDKVCSVMRCGLAPEKLEIRLGDVTLEDPMPLHFCGIKDGSKVDVLKPYANVKIQNNKGAAIYWRLDRKDTINEVKVKLATAQSNIPMRFYLYSSYPYNYDEITSASASGPAFNEIRGLQECSMSVAGMRLYNMKDDGNKLEELLDDETVDNYKIKDGDKLYLFSYKWLHSEVDVTVLKTNTKIQGVELDETCLGIKVKVQDQTGLPANTLHLTQFLGNGFDIKNCNGCFINDRNKQGVHQERAPLMVITEEEWRAECLRRREQQHL